MMVEMVFQMPVNTFFTMFHTTVIVTVKIALMTDHTVSMTPQMMFIADEMNDEMFVNTVLMTGQM